MQLRNSGTQPERGQARRSLAGVVRQNQAAAPAAIHGIGGIHLGVPEKAALLDRL
jgi:hypothetical protein